MLIKGESAYLEINMVTRSHPESSDYWDGNWITSVVKITIPAFTVNMPLELRSDELSNLLEALLRVMNGSANEFLLRTLEDALYVKGEVELTGTIKWHCRVIYPIGDGAKLEFDFDSDFSQVNSLIDQLKEEIQFYPIIGTP